MSKTIRDIEQIKTILIIQFRPFGDVLLTTSILPTLKKLYPDAMIHFAVFEPYHQIIRHNPYIDRLIVKRKKESWWQFYRKISAFSYDLLLDYQSTNQSAMIVAGTSARLKVGLYKMRPRVLAYDVKVNHGEKRYAAWMKFDYLKVIGIREEIREFKAYYPEESREFVRQYFEQQGINPDKPKILISPNSPREYKKWKPEYFAEVADRLAQNPNHTIFILQGPGEEEYVRFVMRHIKNKVRIAPAMNIDQLLAWMDFMNLYIGNCGGPKHMAVALGTPSITIFGPTDPIVWHPHEMPEHIALVNEEKRFLDNTFGIQPDQVIEAAENLLKKHRPS